jgi:hypothetical protein
MASRAIVGGRRYAQNMSPLLINIGRSSDDCADVGPANGASSTASCTTPSDQSTDASGDALNTFVGPAVVAALVSVVLGAVFTRYKDRKAARRELQLRSLNEFYAPIVTLLAENAVLKNAIRDELEVPPSAEWHMLDHRAEVKENPQANALMLDLLAVNDRIADVIELKSGLDLGALHHVSTWKVHRQLLARGFPDGAVEIKSNLAYFPREFEAEVVATHKTLVDAVKSSVGIKR